MLIDTHCHLNLGNNFPDPAAEIAFSKTMGVEKLIVVGIDLESSQRALDLSDRFDEIYAVVGIHPNNAAKFDLKDLPKIEQMLAHPKALALGEMGLDYHWDHATPAQQYDLLKAQLHLAEKVKTPVVFHCREAYTEVLDILETHPRNPWLLHCFAGNHEQAQRAIAMDCYFGVDGPLTYKTANELREIVQTLPRDRVVIETDAPYLTPAPHRGKPNRPAYVSYINSMLASLWGVSSEEAAKQTTENAMRFFRIG